MVCRPRTLVFNPLILSSRADMDVLGILSIGRENPLFRCSNSVYKFYMTELLGINYSPLFNFIPIYVKKL